MFSYIFGLNNFIIQEQWGGNVSNESYRKKNLEKKYTCKRIGIFIWKVGLRNLEFTLCTILEMRGSSSGFP